MVAKRLYNSLFVTIIVSALLTGPGSLSHIVNAEEQGSSQEIQSLAEKGDPSAQLRLAEMYEQGDGVPKDHYRACLWAQTAAALSASLITGEESDRKRAHDLREAVCSQLTEEQGLQVFLEASQQAERIFLADLRKEYPEGLQRYQAAAEAGDAEAQFQLGKMYSEGYDFDKALAWYRKAAEQDHRKAQYMLGYMYYEGNQEVPQDYEQAYYWLLRKTDGDEGDKESPQRGEFIARVAAHVNPEKRAAIRQEIAQHVELADAERRTRAAQGDSRAQYELGYMYYRGLRVSKDQAQAYQWFRKAADQGFVWAFNNVGGAYYFGHGVEKNGAEAVRWYRKAAEHGDAHTQSFLGKIYSDGFVVPKDLYQAYFWLTLAASRGQSNEWKRGSDLRDVVAKQLTSEQIAQAEKEAAAWRQSE